MVAEDVTEQRFARWLGERLGAPVMVDSFVAPSQGFSNDTWMTEIDDGSGPRGVVVRLAPRGTPLFPEYDLGMQARIIGALGRHSQVPVPKVLWEEPDPSVLGRPFFVMERVDGRIPPDYPGYLFSGWVKELAADAQAVVLDSTLRTLAAIHTVDRNAAGLDFLPGVGIDRELRYWYDYLRWAEVHDVTIERGYELCLANRPATEPPVGLVWGDARLGNLVFGDRLEVVAVLDWEMALLGPAELDLGWYLFLDRIMLRFTPQLEGFGERDAAIRTYEGYLGRSIEDLHWYEAWAGVRAAAINHRLERLRGGPAQGLVDPVAETLGELLGLNNA
jgi:aminoglycoside phosphotransferase (APT) family kinase protein